MKEERRRQLELDPNAKLTQEEIDAGWFFCCDWDGMLMHKTSYEAQNCCSCIASERTEEEKQKKASDDINADFDKLMKDFNFNGG